MAANDPSVQNNGETLTATPNVFNYYLAQVMPTQPPNYTGVNWPPNTTTVFGAANQNSPISITSYWATMSAYLTSTAGMSGLGIFAGLGMIVEASKRWPSVAGSWPHGRNGASTGDTGLAAYEQINSQWPEVPGANWFGAGRAVQ